MIELGGLSSDVYVPNEQHVPPLNMNVSGLQIKLYAYSDFVCHIVSIL